MSERDLIFHLRVKTDNNVFPVDDDTYIIYDKRFSVKNSMIVPYPALLDDNQKISEIFRKYSFEERLIGVSIVLSNIITNSYPESIERIGRVAVSVFMEYLKGLPIIAGFLYNDVYIVGRSTFRNSMVTVIAGRKAQVRSFSNDLINIEDGIAFLVKKNVWKKNVDEEIKSRILQVV